MATATTTTDSNHSNAIIDSATIRSYFSLWEGNGLAEYWIAQVGKESLTDSKKEELRKNFARSNPPRRIIKRLAGSMPKWHLACGDVDLPGTPTEAQIAASETRGEQIEEAFKEIAGREGWEGEMNLWAASDFWREIIHVGGDIFVKLPLADGLVLPERMPAEDSRIMMDPKRRKIIAGFRFEYAVGSEGQYVEDDNGANRNMIERITAKEWVVIAPNETIKGQPIPPKWGFIPVSHMAWETRENSPRGLPLFKRLLDLSLHFWSVKMDRRIGNKLNAAPVGVRTNADGPAVQYGAGGTLDLKDASPLQKADFKLEGGNLNLASIEQEYADTKAELNEEGFVPNETKEDSGSQNSPSGKAIQKLTASMIAYRQSYLPVEQRFLEDLIFKCLVIEGKVKDLNRNEITIQYDPISSPDQGDTIELARLYLEMDMPEQALKVLGNEDEKIDDLMKQREAQALRRQAQFMLTQPTDDEEDDEKGGAGGAA